MNLPRNIFLSLLLCLALLAAGLALGGETAWVVSAAEPETPAPVALPNLDPPGRAAPPSFGFSLAENAPPATTPELIEAAFQRGEITAEERLLYLTYAVYDYESLPAEFHSNSPWGGTQVVAEVKAAAAKLQADPALQASPRVRSVIERMLSPQAATVCDVNDMANNVNSTHFHVNYGSIGAGLSISDYTTALETTFGVEVTSYGWAQPPLCTAARCTNDNPWDRYPVQASALGGGLYGYVTYPGGSYTGVIGNNPNTPATETASLASCMVLNSNYTGFGGALAALQVTAAHEFNHAIQFGYGDPGTLEDDIWYESIATYIEDDVYDSANDNYNYLYPTFTSCMGQYGGNVYSDWLFFRYAAEQTGGTNLAGGGEDVAQGFWANVSVGQSGLGAYNNALASKGTNLNDIYHNYAIASRYMKSCPGSAPYCYEEAAGYVTAAGMPSDQGSIAGTPGSYTGSLGNNYALNWVDLPVSGPFTVTLRNNSTTSGVLRASLAAETPGGLVVTAIPGLANASQTIQLAGYTVPAGATGLVAVITNQQMTADNPSSCAAAGYTLSLSKIGTGGGGGGEIGDKQAYLPVVHRLQALGGQITQNGAPVAGTEVGLRYFDGSTWSTAATTTSAADGSYSFTGLPAVGSGKKLYLVWDNQSNDLTRLSYWRCTEITTAGMNSVCIFDIQGVDLAAPTGGTATALPVSFSWTPRAVYGDQYRLRLFNPSGASNLQIPWFESPGWDYTDNYALSSLPTGFSPTGTYDWEVLVSNSQGYGASQESRPMSFALAVTRSGTNRVVNGTLESGRLAGWQEYSSQGWALVTKSGFPEGVSPHGGQWAAWLGGDYNETSRLYQQVAVPTNSPMLGFWYWSNSVDSCGNDYAWVVISTPGLDQKITEYDLCSSMDTNGWREAYLSLQSYAGQTVTVQFWVETGASNNSNFFIDDIWLGSGNLSAAASAPAQSIAPSGGPSNAADPLLR